MQYENVNSSKVDLYRVIRDSCPRLHDEAPAAQVGIAGPSRGRRLLEYHELKEFNLIPICLSLRGKPTTTNTGYQENEIITSTAHMTPHARAFAQWPTRRAGDAGPRTAPNSNIPVHVLEVLAPVLKEWFGYSLYACTFTGNEFVWDSRAAGKINSIAFKQEWDRAVAVLNDADINSGPA